MQMQVIPTLDRDGLAANLRHTFLLLYACWAAANLGIPTYCFQTSFDAPLTNLLTR